MSQIDLRYATVNIIDGYTPFGPGTTQWLVNNVAGYPTGTVTMIIDGGTGALAVGDTFTVAGETTLPTPLPVHKITAHTETTGNTTSITFTPATVGAVTDNGVITILPHSIEVKVGEGTMTYDEKRKMEYVMNRNIIDTVRQGADEPVDVRFDLIWDFITAISGSGVPTVEDALKKRGEAANWVTSGADPCEPYSVDIQVIYTPPCPGVNKETITLQEFRYESLNHEFKQGMIAVTGKCKISQATAVRG